MLTREEALDLISDVEKFYCESADEYGYYCYEAESVIDKIYDSFEEAMKPKTCKGCKQSWEPNNQTFHKYFCEYLKIPIHSNFCCNRHEPKDNAWQQQRNYKTLQ